MVHYLRHGSGGWIVVHDSYCVNALYGKTICMVIDIYDDGYIRLRYVHPTQIWIQIEQTNKKLKNRLKYVTKENIHFPSNNLLHGRIRSSEMAPRTSRTRTNTEFCNTIGCDWMVTTHIRKRNNVDMFDRIVRWDMRCHIVFCFDNT